MATRVPAPTSRLRTPQTLLLIDDQEVPPVLTTTTGRFKIEFNTGATKGYFELRIDDGVRITQTHLHCAPAGVNGPIVIFLAGFHDRGWDLDGKWVGNATVTDANIVNPACGATLAEIVEQIWNGIVYVNAHSVPTPPSIPAASSGDSLQAALGFNERKVDERRE